MKLQEADLSVIFYHLALLPNGNQPCFSSNNKLLSSVNQALVYSSQ